MKALICLLIRGYQKLLSPVIHSIGGPGSGCRFTPTCSEYFLQAVNLHGACRGTRLGLKRIARCQPWGGSGHDPVPEKGKHDCHCDHDPARHSPPHG